MGGFTCLQIGMCAPFCLSYFFKKMASIWCSSYNESINIIYLHSVGSMARDARVAIVWLVGLLLACLFVCLFVSFFLYLFVCCICRAEILAFDHITFADIRLFQFLPTLTSTEKWCYQVPRSATNQEFLRSKLSKSQPAVLLHRRRLRPNFKFNRSRRLSPIFHQTLISRQLLSFR